MAIASLASVTVSIAAEMIGRLRRIERVSCVPRFVALGMTALNPGRSKTSSNARPSGIKLDSATAIAMRPHVDRTGGRRKTRIRCMTRLPNMGAAKFLASSGYGKITHVEPGRKRNGRRYVPRLGGRARRPLGAARRPAGHDGAGGRRPCPYKVRGARVLEVRNSKGWTPLPHVPRRHDRANECA